MFLFSRGGGETFWGQIRKTGTDELSYIRLRTYVGPLHWEADFIPAQGEKLPKLLIPM